MYRSVLWYSYVGWFWAPLPNTTFNIAVAILGSPRGWECSQILHQILQYNLNSWSKEEPTYLMPAYKSHIPRTYISSSSSGTILNNAWCPLPSYKGYFFFRSRFSKSRRTICNEIPPTAKSKESKKHSYNYIYPEIRRHYFARCAEPVEESHWEDGLLGNENQYSIFKRLREELLTAKKVPGKNTIVTIAIDLICRESRPVDKAISTFVSPRAWE